MYSNLDTDALVKSMTSAQQSKIDTVKAKQTKQEWYSDALTSVKTSVSEFLSTYVSSTGSSSMLKASTYGSYTAVTSSTANAVSVTASSTAELGDLTIQVNTLATNAYATSSGKISESGTEISSNNTTTLEDLSLSTDLEFNSSGKISFAINGKTFNFSQDTTLQSMINTINTDTTANVTMKYSRLTDTFTITADSGGADSSVTISNLQGNAFGADSAFKINTGTFSNGTDSEAVINGVTVTKDSNDYTIDGVTYGLNKVTKGTTEAVVDFSLEHDYSSTVSAVSDFIDAYNTLYDSLKSLDTETDYSADYPPLTDDEKADMTTDQITAWETKAKSGILRHNSDLESLMSSLKNAFYSSLGGTSKNATTIGITTAGYFDTNAGEIVLDEDALTTALQSNSTEVIAMFTNGSSTSASSDQGLMYKLRSSLTNYTTEVKTSVDTATSKIDKYDTEISDLEDKLEESADRYYSKFSAMETALSKLNSQSSFISQMFGTSTSSS
jgi:flagellar hook-associated protein 2